MGKHLIHDNGVNASYEDIESCQRVDSVAKGHGVGKAISHPLLPVAFVWLESDSRRYKWFGRCLIFGELVAEGIKVYGRAVAVEGFNGLAIERPRDSVVQVPRNVRAEFDCKQPRDGPDGETVIP